MNTALFVIATGEKYHQYIDPLLESARKHFVPHVPFLWTDSPTRTHKAFQFHLNDEGYPSTTLHRYNTFLKHKEIISANDQIFYVDIDMLFIAPIGEEVFSDGITATEHPGYVGLNGPSEKRLNSTAYCPVLKNYFCGGFNGGETKAFLKMAETIAANIDEDAKNGVTAVWHDESHLNRYLYDNPPARILDPSFCYPESEYKTPGYYNAIWRSAGRTGITPKLLALDKK